MRKDITRLLVLRGKCGQRWAHRPPRIKGKRRTADELDRLPRRSGMRAGYERKYFDEYLAPLKRFLQKRVGRRWDAVYSEIRAHLRVSRAVHLHVLQHLEEMVVLRAWRENGQLVGVDSWGCVGPLRWSRWCAYYVDESGVLQAIPPGRRRRKRVNPEQSPSDAPSHIS
ncbi:MAG: hypothetical protein AAF411_13395 [Myxococcota bacterium]